MAPSAVEITHINELAHKIDPPVEHNIEEHVAFGGDDQWYYHIPSRRFDLSRGATRKLILDADDGIRNHRGCAIDPAKTVLVVIDMQNYFVHPMYHDHSGGIATIDPLLKVIERCRQEGIQVLWCNWGIDDHDLKVMPAAVTRGFNRNMIKDKGHGWHVGLGAPIPDNKGGKERCLFMGTWNADIYEPLKTVMTPDDVRFDKARMSGMWSPELPMHKWLTQSGKKTLLFAGVNTDQCLLGTLTDAYNWGWDCILLSDCAATMTGLNAQQVCDHNIATNMGFVADSKDFIYAPIVDGPLSRSNTPYPSRPSTPQV
ncbi:isochorismatase hydrolase [Delphinella strobiligena]|nr:isochorismatase hydrolase [Delphinella strobiligena]